MRSRQRMVVVCASFTLDIDMKFNSKKSAVMRVGPRFKEPFDCEPIMLCSKQLSFVSDVKYRPTSGSTSRPKVQGVSVSK